MLQGDAGQSSPNYDDTDLEDSVTSLLRDEKDETSSSDEDSASETPCPRVMERRHREMFEMQRKMTFRGRMVVGNRETFRELREDILCLCNGLSSASTSIAEVCRQREICRPRGGSSLNFGTKTRILNQFLPNCRRVVDKLRSKSFCCSYIKGGTELVVSSQDEFIRFFEQRGPRDRYFLKNAIRVPITTWSILDVAVNRKGDALCYGTWKDSVFFARFLVMLNAFWKFFVVTISDAHADDINAVCYGDTDSNLLYSGGDDGLVKRKTVNCVRQQSWDYRWQPAPPCTLTPLKGDTSVITLRGHSVLHTLVRAKFSPSRTGKQFIYTGCARGEVVIYDLLANSSSSSSNESGSNPVARRLPGHVAVVRDVDWNPSSNEIATCAWDGVTAIWKWDERHDHVTSTEVNQIGAEDSCDESYQPVVKRRKAVQRRLKCSAKRRQQPRAEEATESPNPELLYTF
ncbi:WD domain, G-beta repeat protein [Teladorsagia circumcincta]|uniref:WD domain, G-beta repeat protein n=1 Tax=Teladorsagia circumcincta TaxID=45464 RepID=A0A2G9UCP2_TELCI|nr:WD domain, G-beta repeat protein [Teladorsagia circumcincta]